MVGTPCCWQHASKHDRPARNHKIQDGGGRNRSTLPQSFHKELRREDTRERGSQGIDKIEDADTGADVGALRDQESDQDRQCGTHEQRWQHHQDEGDEPGLRHAGRHEAHAYPIEDLERHQPEQTNGQFYDAVGNEKSRRPAARRPAAGERAQSQSEEEGRDDRSGRFSISPINGEECALPDHLVEQRRDTGDEEKRI